MSPETSRKFRLFSSGGQDQGHALHPRRLDRKSRNPTPFLVPNRFLQAPDRNGLDHISVVSSVQPEPHFRLAMPKTSQTSTRRLRCGTVLDILKHWTVAAKLVVRIRGHRFRAASIKSCLEAVRVDKAEQMAAREPPRTTKRCDGTSDATARGEVETILN
jgi:hypothetical protein